MSTVLEVKNLTSNIKRNHVPIFTSASFSLRGGDRLVLSGSSGAGKSLLLRSIAFLEPTAEGEVWFQNQKVGPEGVPSFRSKVVYLSQKPILLEGTVEDNLSSFFQYKIHQGKTFDTDKAIRKLKLFGFEPSFLSKPAKLLSGGEAQVINLIRAWMAEPKVMLLDEPTASLDQSKTETFEAVLKKWAEEEGEKAFIWITHQKEQERKVGNRFLRLNESQLTESP